MRWERYELEPDAMNYRVAACLVAAIGIVAVFGAGMLMMDRSTMVEPSGLRVPPGATLTTCTPAGTAWTPGPLDPDEAITPEVGTARPLHCY